MKDKNLEILSEELESLGYSADFDYEEEDLNEEIFDVDESSKKKGSGGYYFRFDTGLKKVKKHKRAKGKELKGKSKAGKKAARRLTSAARKTNARKFWKSARGKAMKMYMAKHKK